jgi:hypothetical protein
MLRSVGFFMGALWWGSLTTIGFLVVPLLFVWVSPKALAGLVAGHLFEWASWVSLLTPLLLWVLARVIHPLTPHGPQERDWAWVLSEGQPGSSREPAGAGAAESVDDTQISRHWRWSLWGLGGSAALALGMLTVVIPHITLGVDRATWHGVGTLTYALMWGLASVLLHKSRRFWS